MTEEKGTLFVSAYEEELVESDECKVGVTITNERVSAVEAQKASTKTFDAVQNALSAAKIESEIETTFFNVEKPRYYDSTKQKYVIQNFFRATHNLTVKARTEEAGNAARTCTLNESTVSGVRFQLSKELEQSSRDKALSKAVKLAQKKALLLAKSAGVELGTLQSLVDRAQSMTINAPTNREYLMTDAALMSPKGPDEEDYELNFANKKIHVHESVQLSYNII
jgi:uncharacterized protein YggE